MTLIPFRTTSRTNFELFQCSCQLNFTLNFFLRNTNNYHIIYVQTSQQQQTATHIPAATVRRASVQVRSGRKPQLIILILIFVTSDLLIWPPVCGYQNLHNRTQQLANRCEYVLIYVCIFVCKRHTTGSLSVCWYFHSWLPLNRLNNNALQLLIVVIVIITKTNICIYIHVYRKNNNKERGVHYIQNVVKLNTQRHYQLWKQ